MANETDALKKAFIKEVTAAAGKSFVVNVFADMVRAMAISIESAMLLDEKRKGEIEEEYARIKAAYDEDDFAHFYAAFAIVFEALEKHREDFLGHALEALGAANTRNGQFLTPVHISRLMARMTNKGIDYKPGQIITLSDPACGSSVLLIEGAEALMEEGVQQGDILLLAGDVDSRACDISYVQLSLLGYPAVVQHADALSMKRLSPDRYTPGWFLHCMPMRRPFRAAAFSPPSASPTTPTEPPPSTPPPTPSPVSAPATPEDFMQQDLFGMEGGAK